MPTQMTTQLVAETSLFGWYVGYAIGALVVVIVVVVVSWIIRSATRIGGQAHQATEAVRSATASTDPLWELTTTNRALARLHDKLRHTRSALE